ncbi:hypothetical protein [Brenneria tiliae]|uniref:hypothetical protein n=1 Tax=Brenneria tiliae TaxID=2914984 RepID=UPI0020149BCD|nr:hypothetical protein [Brenneria tiliae]MCL2896836.1 hypothetical protein [Brenneria tiliae]MCL2901394.1 hypothetical protein [Brenneria tiliae]
MLSFYIYAAIPPPSVIPAQAGIFPMAAPLLEQIPACAGMTPGTRAGDAGDARR